MKEWIILAYVGGLPILVAIPWLVQESVTGSVRVTPFKGTLPMSGAAELDDAAVPRT